MKKTRTLARSTTHVSTHTHTIVAVAALGAAGIAAYAFLNIGNNQLYSTSQACSEKCNSIYACENYDANNPNGGDVCRYQRAACISTCGTDVTVTSGASSNGFDIALSPDEVKLPILYVGDRIDLPLRTNQANYQVWNLSSGALPAGLALSANGMLYGVPSTVGEYHIVLSLKDGAGSEALQPLVMTVVANPNNPSPNTPNPNNPDDSTAGSTVNGYYVKIKTDALAQAVVGNTYTQALAIDTNAPNYSYPSVVWKLLSGRLPSGLSFDDKTGVISGRPTETGNFAIGIGASYDPSGTGTFLEASADRRSYTLTVGSSAQSSQNAGPIAVATESLPDGRASQSYAYRLQATGGLTPYTWSVSGELPAGMTLSSDGLLSGTPRTSGYFGVSVIVASADDNEYGTRLRARKTYRWKVERNVASLAIVTGSLPEAVEGQSYSIAFSGAGGSGSYRFSAVSGLPSSMTMSSAGVLSGTPSSPGVYTIRVRLDDRVEGVSTERDYTLNVRSRINNVQPGYTYYSPLSFVEVGPYPDGYVSQYYSARPYTVSGGVTPYTWMVVSGSLPEGLSLGSNGEIVGAPRRAGTYSFTMEVRDNRGYALRAARTIRVFDGTYQVYSSAPAQASYADGGLQSRLNTISSLGLSVHDLIKLQDDGNPYTQYDTTVYYIGADGRRHAFPNPHVYFTWYSDYARVRIVAPSTMDAISLGANVTYRPGIRLVKFQGSPRVYAVDSGRRLRWISSPAVAEALYGPVWMRNVQDIPDAFYGDYIFGQDIVSASDYQPFSAVEAAKNPSVILP